MDEFSSKTVSEISQKFFEFYKPFESRQTYPILKYCQQMSLRSENKDLKKSEKVLTEAVR